MAVEIYTADAINLLYLYEKTGEYGDTTITFAEIKDYVEYIAKVRKIEIKSGKETEVDVERPLSILSSTFSKNIKRIDL
ncbi:hypothetical protein [Lactococcus allomyrinae]|uniref:Uncharacterized protein n=1 Tax=Lactococcus allomyrinae TaxID=2419773 RepID=A0A387B7N4_9LACT|nr:hypothetical protein [Lactococcus allomyrinae]AYF99794.1 hypothetical protein D7I46_01065 [Lactococcus allomyrinae]